MNRRTLLQTSTGLAALRALPGPLLAGTGEKRASDTIPLGPRKIRLSRMAVGTGTNGVGGASNQTRQLGLGGLADLLKAAFDSGITFWDSADQYGTHAHVREALKRVPREKVVILTKTHASTEAEMKADIDRFRRELGTDYIDILLLHCMMDGGWPARKRGAMESISKLQEKGIVRTKGVSCHTLAALRSAAASRSVEVDLARFNPAGASMDAPPSEVLPVLRQMKAAGKGIIGMKLFGAGALRGRIDECLQFALAHSVIDCFTIGVESIAELRDLGRRISAASLRL